MDNITIPSLKNWTPMFAFLELYRMNLLALLEYSTLFNPFLIESSILSISLTAIGLKSCVEGPCATMVKQSNLSASIVGILDPPKSPRGPGCTDGDMNNALIPFSVLKLTNVTIVSMASLMFSNSPSRELDPSFMWAMNKLNKSRTPMPRFFLNGDAMTVMKA